MRRPIAFAAALLLAACAQPAEPTFDGSSQSTFAASLTEVRQSLPPIRRAKFEAALKLVEAEVFAESGSRTEYQANLRRRLDGATADTVIADAVAQRDEAGRRLADGVFDAKRQLEEAKQAVDDLAKAGEATP